MLTGQGANALGSLLDRGKRQVLLEEPFAEARVELLGELSRRISSSPHFRRDPSLATLGGWLRPSTVIPMIEACRTRDKAGQGRFVRVPDGLVFHIAPSNVDTVFAYSWALSYVCGNVNIVRLSSERGETIAELLSILSALGDNERRFAAQNAFISYAHDEAVTETLSMACDHRMVWGGNETVSRVRAVKLNPHASERYFSSKFSYALVDVSRFMGDSESAREKLAKDFCADMLPFSQMACASPHVVFWVGNHPNDCKVAAEVFDKAVSRHIQHLGRGEDVGVAARRHINAFELAASVPSRVRLGLNITTAFVDDVADIDRQIRGGGFLIHAGIEDVASLCRFASDGDQTLTYWGLDEQSVRDLAAKLGMLGVDRVVPIGKALDFGPTWDGFDLLDDLTRKVSMA